METSIADRVRAHLKELTGGQIKRISVEPLDSRTSWPMVLAIELEDGSFLRTTLDYDVTVSTKDGTLEALSPQAAHARAVALEMV